SKEVFASVDTEVTSSLTLRNRYIKDLDLYTYNSDKETGSVNDNNELIVAKIYDRKEFPVTFDSNGEVLNSEDLTDRAFKWGQNPTDLPIPKREDHRFMGWYLDIDGNDPFDSMPQDNVTVYAKWEPLYWISFVDGGSLEDPLDYIENEEVIEPVIPTKVGHTFDGWYKDQDFTEELVFPFDMPARNVEVYVKWNVKPYSITFDTDGGNPIDDEVFDFGSDLSGYELPTPVKEGFTFIGWFADADYTELFVLPATMPADNITLYAKWELIED
ncbi:MAG TPA: InlB B-repeat-containing protein, partial [Bacilli bacterium]|nr:InlB B-repeat-containing protein [Bacilli bacterium]